jgi:hypothetical protein
MKMDKFFSKDNVTNLNKDLCLQFRVLTPERQGGPIWSTFTLLDLAFILRWEKTTHKALSCHTCKMILHAQLTLHVKVWMLLEDNFCNKLETLEKLIPNVL